MQVLSNARVLTDSGHNLAILARVSLAGREVSPSIARQRARQGQVLGAAGQVLQGLQLVQPLTGHTGSTVHLLHSLKNNKRLVNGGM